MSDRERDCYLSNAYHAPGTVIDFSDSSPTTPCEIGNIDEKIGIITNESFLYKHRDRICYFYFFKEAAWAWWLANVSAVVWASLQ